MSQQILHRIVHRSVHRIRRALWPVVMLAATTGIFLARDASAVEDHQRCKAAAPEQKVLLDFKGDIRELVSAISKATCRNFIIPEKLTAAKFEIHSVTPVTAEEAWRAFLSALAASDLTVVQLGRYFRVAPVADGAHAAVPLYEEKEEGPLNDRVITQIFRLEHAPDADAVVRFLTPFKSTSGQLAAFPGTGTLIVTDFGTVIDRLRRILAEIDRPGAAEQVHVVPVDHATPTLLAERLNQILDASKANAGTPAHPGGQAPAGHGAEPAKILADDRSGQLVVIAAEPAFDRIMDLKKRLDVPGQGTDAQVQVIHLKHAEAEKLAATLVALAQGKPSAIKSGPAGMAGPGGVASLGRAGEPGPSAGLTGAGSFQGEVRITASKETNSLLVVASRSDMALLREVIARLDVPRLQVFVEAVIMEIAKNGDRQLGASFHLGLPLKIFDTRSPAVFSSAPAAGFSSLGATLDPTSLLNVLGLAASLRGGTIPGTSNLVAGGIPAIGLLLQALQTTNEVNVVSMPWLLSQDTVEATIKVVRKVPYSSGLPISALSSLVAGGSAPSIAALGAGTVQKEPIGLTLKITPQVRDEDYVSLEVHQELSEFEGTEASTKAPITSTRDLENSVLVHNEDTVVLGGLEKNGDSVTEGKTPLLGDLPLLGWLFKHQDRTDEKVNLVLLLTPHIIRRPDDLQAIFERKMKERQEFAARFYGDVQDYRAAIDWSRKLGPVASLRQAIHHGLEKAENGGAGAPGEEVIRAEPDDGEPPR